MMNEHVSHDDIRRFRSGELEIGAIRRVANHVAACAECAALADAGRSGVRLANTLARALTDMEDDHLDSTALDHIAHCERCREDVHDVVGIAAQPPRRKRFRALAYGAAAALMIAFLIAILRPREPEAARIPAVRHVQRPVRQYARAGWTDAVRSAIAEGKLDAPAAFLRLQQPPDAFRGEDAGEPIPARLVQPRLVQPVDELVDSTRPTLRWTAPPAALVVVSIVEHAQLVGTSRELSGSEWQPDGPLVPGHTYEWQIEVRHGGRTVTVPSPPDPPARFTVLGADAAADLAAARASHPGDHLLLAALYARAGLRGDAQRQLTMLANENAELARRLQQSLDRWPHRVR